MSRRLNPSFLITVPLVLGAAGLLAHFVWILAGEPASSEALISWIYDGSVALAGVTCLVRAAVSRELRGAWIAFGVGLAAWAAGDIYWVQALSELKPKDVPYPSGADVGYLVALPCFFVGIALLIRYRIGHFTAASWFDGAIGGLAAAALGTAILAPALVGLTKGDPAAVMTNLAYPLGDLLLIAFLTGALVIGGVRGAWSILFVGIGLSIWTWVDITYLYQIASGTYVGGMIDNLWPLGALLIALGARVSASMRPRPSVVYRSSLLFPSFFTLLVAGILVWDHFDRLSSVSVWLAGATVATVVVRLGVSFRENDRLMNVLHGDSVTDALTGMPNRRHLFDDLERLFDHIGDCPPKVFALFDLDGFKNYNDSFGHPAGDALLQRLGGSLSAALGSDGIAYRLGGDEFCTLIDIRDRKPLALVEMARAALSEEGEGFSIGASGGWIVLPDDASTASEAVNEVDQRMYAEKNRRSTRSTQQTQEVLMRVFREREPELSGHVDGVTRLALEVGRRLNLDAEELDVLARGAELHDLGKIAIPDEVLEKRGPLDDAEWALMRRHTLIGYRILDATPAMKPVARLVRSSHERWDGAGYPDGLAGADIPLGSRIIFACDSFDAMTADRPYRVARTREEAVQELRRCAGTQFDPTVIDILCDTLERISTPTRASTESAVAGNGNGRPAAISRSRD